MWTVIYVSQSRELAAKLANALDENAIISRIRGSWKKDTGSGCCYEVLVPGTEMEAAQDLIIENDLF